MGPDLEVHYALTTFDARIDAEAWLAAEHRLVEFEIWTPPARRAEIQEETPILTLDAYAASWLESRDLKPRTRFHYARILERLIKPSLGQVAIDTITPALVRSWYSSLPSDRPTMRAHTYSLLRTIFSAAHREQLVPVNPCTIPGAGSSKRVHKIEPASTEELNAIVEAMPERYRVAVLLAAWCSLRFGELIELRRGDIDTKRGVVKVRRAVVQVTGGRIVGTPKSTAGIRDVTVPPHVREAINDHLDRFVGKSRDALVMPGENNDVYLSRSVLHRRFQKATEAAGRSDLRWHDLRHTGAVLAAQAGATLPELMNRLGHASAQAALRYQHLARDRDAEIAAAMSSRALRAPQTPTAELPAD
jgi:integrase